MQKTSIRTTLTLAMALLAGQVHSSPSAYFQAVTNLNPAAYWPLNETAQPPAPFANSMIATNSGSAGTSANGYYGGWYQPNGNTWYLTNNVVQTNGITAPFDGDQALWCKFQAGQYVVVPRTKGGVVNSAVTIVPPMTLEVWVVPTTTVGNNAVIVSEGQCNVSYGGPNTNDSYYGGLGGPGWAGFALGQYQNYFYFNYYMTNAQSKANEVDSLHPTGGASSLITNTWNHVVCTFDGTTETMWVNGVSVKQVTHAKNAAGLTWAPDLTTPLMIGCGNDVTAGGGSGTVAYTGAVDEVAIYNQVLSQTSILNHYMAGYGTNASGASVNYATVVQGDSPALYYRLDDTQVMTNAGYPSANYPVATNYGTLGSSANGAYQPGTTPGVAGPSYTGFGSGTAAAFNGFFGAVDVGGSNLPAALNPVGTAPLTIVSWFQGNPADAPARYQDIVGHGNNSYRLALGTTAGENRFNPGATNGPELQFVSVADMVTNAAAKNDGNWHMAVGVTDGTNAYMYLDGVLSKSTNSITGISIVGSNIDLLLGGDPQNSIASANAGGTDRTFDGQIAHVAIWTNALTVDQIQSLYNVAGVPPSISIQPVGATNNQGAAVSIPAMVGGSQPITYQWYTNGTAVAGQTNQALTFASVTTNAIGNYYLIANSAYGSATSAVVQLFIYGLPTLLAQSQGNLDIFAGSRPVLSVSAVGAPPISYQWLSNNVPVASATNNSYTVVNAANNATYTCSVTNIDGGITAGPFTLTVLPDPTAPYPVTILSDHPIAFFRLDESSGTSAYDYVGGNNGTYTPNVQLNFVPSYDVKTDPTEGNAPGFGILATNNGYVGSVPTNISFSAPTNVNGEFSVECWVQEYPIKTDAGIISLGYGNGGEEFALDTGGADPNHYYRFYVRNAGGTSESAASGVTTYTDGAWHHLVGVCDETNGHVYLYIDGTNAATGTIPSKSGVLASTQSLAIGARQESQGSQYDNQFIGAIDEVALYNYALTPAQVQTHYLSSGIAPVITQLTPSPETTNVGSTATFTVAAQGTAPLYYMWYGPTNNLISTNTTLSLSNVQVSAQGQYTIVASNVYGTVTGSVSLQVVLGQPQISQDITPLTQTVPLYSGLSTVTYTVGVSGTAPFAYQWYQDGTKVLNATNSSYMFTALAGTNTYYVAITNSYTASQGGGVPATSSTATVIGLVEPQLNPTNYAYRVNISFPGFTGQPLTNFPALIMLSPSVAGFAYSQLATNGSDLRFTDASGTTMLPYEIDEWNNNGVSTIWVEIPLLNGTNIWAYWGNSSPTNVPPAPTNVWLNAGYQIVYHLKESALPFADSTGQFPATKGVAPAPTPGVVGHGGAFDGLADYLSPGPVTLSNQFTTYAWVYLLPAANDIKTIWANQVGGYGANGFTWFVDTYQTADRINHFDSGNGAGSGQDPTGSTGVSPSQWHFMAATWDLQNQKVTTYLDGALNGSGTAVGSLGLTNSINLGAFLNPTYYWDGDMDEARIQYGVASTNWLTATYLNMAQGSYVSYSAVNLQPVLTIITSTNGYTLSWPANDGVFTLEATTNLTPPASWSAVTPGPVITNGVYQETVQPLSGSHFYRLQSQ
ncbi:MAG TPA: DUF2341 domain-containing protein [Candidatus Saccharimonadales bacterium]|nr:DUF2341 domain-containing protein [Candidatus Saccharimonadales bacterium]